MRPRTALAALACDSALTRDEFVTQANAICAAGNAKIEAAVPENSSVPPSGDAGTRFYETIVDETQNTVDGIAALEPPAEIEADVDAMVAAARDVLAEMRATPADEFFQTNEDAFAEVNETASSLGLDACAT